MSVWWIAALAWAVVISLMVLACVMADRADRRDAELRAERRAWAARERAGGRI